jgi:hypothetical protein
MQTSGSSASPATTTAAGGTTPTKISSDKVIDVTIQKGIEQILAKTTAGILLGGILGIGIARGRLSQAHIRTWAGFGGGLGLGSAWTQTSIELERLVEGGGKGSE